MLKEKEVHIEDLEEAVKHVTSNRNTVEEIKIHLEQYGITGGRIEKVLGNPLILQKKGTDSREAFLIIEQLYLKSGLQSINLDNLYSESEIKEARQYYALDQNVDTSHFPFVLENVSIGGNNVYSAMIDIGTISEWMQTDDLFYNFDIQRQAKKKAREGNIIKTPTVYRKNVKEIEDLMLKGELIITTLAFNAATQSSDTGEELTYDSKTKTLTINKGTRLDILDGFHRCLASRGAYTKNPNVNFKFNVLISNYTTREAQQYQAQLAKATPIPNARIQELEANRYADAVVAQLKADSELRGRISSSHSVSTSKGELVSYRVLADAIDREFNMNARVETFGISKFLGNFFDYLIGLNQEEFSYNRNDEKSLMSYNRMFSGYVALAAKMKKENVSPEELNKILEQVDFSRDNKLWTELGILDDNGHIKSTADDKKIADYFKNLNLV